MTDQLLRRVAFLVEIADRKQQFSGRLGKTAMQKLLYLLQEGLGVKLGYRFDLYTYGPYESAVMRDIDYAACAGLLQVKYQGDTGYQITPGPDASALRDYRERVRREAEAALDAIVTHFGNLNASELELRATILYIVRDDPALSDDRVIELVKAIKPKFGPDTIRHAIEHLRQGGLVQEARAEARAARRRGGISRCSSMTRSTPTPPPSAPPTARPRA